MTLTPPGFNVLTVEIQDPFDLDLANR